MEPILRLHGVIKLTGLGRDTIYRLIKAKKFPSSIRLVEGGQATGWIRSEVEKYLADRIAASRNEQKAA
jgi:prophage regulatory protein